MASLTQAITKTNNDMEKFARDSINFLDVNSNLFDFKMVNVLTYLEENNLPILSDKELQNAFEEKAKSLTDLGESLLTLYKSLQEKLTFDQPPKKWSIKKFKEVVCFEEFIHRKFSNVSSSSVPFVDMGAGVGYLTSRLSQNFKTYAIEKNKSYTKNYPSSVAKILNIEISNNIVEELKCIPENRMILVGLHCCGHLTPNCLKAFVNSDNVVAIGIVSCCYHKMSKGIPMSKLFEEMKYGRYFLRLASQRRGNKWFTRGEETEVNEIFNRGITEITNKVEKVPAAEYYKIYDENLWKRDLILTLLKLQSQLQRLCELVVQLDRLCYLKESGFNNVNVFSRVLPESVTPRGEVIFAMK